MGLWEWMIYGTKIAAGVAVVAIVVGVFGALYARGGKPPEDGSSDGE
jgi:hypothetical protein